MSCSTGNLEVNVKGIDGVQAALNVSPTLQISNFKELIEEKIPSCPVARQKLIFRGNVLQDENTIGTYIKEDGLTIHVVVRPEDADIAAAQSADSSGDLLLPGMMMGSVTVGNSDANFNFSELFVHMLNSTGGLPVQSVHTHQRGNRVAGSIDPASLPWAELQNAMRHVSSCHVSERPPPDQSIQAYLHALLGLMSLVAGQIFDTTNSNAFPDSIRPRVRTSMTLLADVLQNTARMLALNHENRRRRRRTAASAPTMERMPGEASDPAVVVEHVSSSEVAEERHRRAEAHRYVPTVQSASHEAPTIDLTWPAQPYYQQSYPSFAAPSQPGFAAVAFPGPGFALQHTVVDPATLAVAGQPFSGAVAFPVPGFSTAFAPNPAAHPQNLTQPTNQARGGASIPPRGAPKCPPPRLPPKAPPHNRAGSTGTTPYFKAPQQNLPAFLSAQRAPVTYVVPPTSAAPPAPAAPQPAPVLQQDLTDSLLRAIESHLASVCGTIASSQQTNAVQTEDAPAAQTPTENTNATQNTEARVTSEAWQATAPPWLHHPAMPDFRQHAIWSQGTPSAQAPPLTAPPASHWFDGANSLPNIRDFLESVPSSDWPTPTPLSETSDAVPEQAHPTPAEIATCQAERDDNAEGETAGPESQTDNVFHGAHLQ